MHYIFAEPPPLKPNLYEPRLAPVLETVFHQFVISYACRQSNSDGSVLKQSHQS